MYASNAGATRMRQSLSYWRSLANAAAKMLNPVNASSSASPDDPPTDQPQTDNQARADDDENSPDVTYANIPDDSPMDQPQTDNQARANGDKNTAEATHANIPDSSGPQSDDRHEANNPGSAETTGDMPGVNRKSKVRPSAMLKTLFSVINIVLRCCLLCAVIYLVTVSESQQNQLTAEYLRQWKQSVITIDKTAATLANVSDWMDRVTSKTNA
ncbi:PREDICTED: uncharacterized protein LOC109470510 [Branchiostoma belcheri]|uniref:Uncharacterized protein LOC109470510 n=1 Tax=Branchiostoma belcheri TaxID=7741 RepID=A0A6P4Y7L9_BRABE|nr:PREDICTED: uncharacterized protein LOC109470510 [Branchiostoma belcheri]